MTDKKDDGGPAFGHGSENGHCCGATLRDYFAGQALAGMLANEQYDLPTSKVAGYAYAIANAMIAERNKP